MRGAIGLLRKPGCIGSATSSVSSSISKQGVSPFSAAFSSSSSGGGSGRGRGRGGPAPSQFQHVPNQPENPKSSDGSAVPTQSAAPTPGRGHGRGNPLPSSPFLPSFKSLGRGSTVNEGAKAESTPKQPMFFRRDDGESSGSVDAEDAVKPNVRRPIGEANLPGSMIGAFAGMGRGKSATEPVTPSHPVEEENRHIQRHGASPQREPMTAESVEERKARLPKLSREEAMKKALNILSAGGDNLDGAGRGQGSGSGRGRGRGSGRGRWSGRTRGAFGRKGDTEADAEEEEEDDIYVGNDADGEKFAKQVGPEVMNTLTEAFEEVAHNVLPSVLEDEYLDALDTNLKIELEPEYLMADFDTNPDIDDKPPIPLRDALEKMRPFLMAYENITSEEEWKEVVEDTMKRVPLLKEIVDHYAGPDSVTAKQQQQELKRVAKTLPASTPNSVKRFTDRAVLTLQSNPGWGFDKKCQFMDKLVAGVSQVYK